MVVIAIVVATFDSLEIWFIGGVLSLVYELGCLVCLSPCLFKGLARGKRVHVWCFMISCINI